MIIFRRTDEDDHARPRAELERTDYDGPPPRYSFATEFQSHEPEVSHRSIELFLFIR